jgi:3-deoxy-manno-octulosonate cytidylyltransferase (CMP-KDO synthetase)
MNIVAVIPARMGSSRMPGKPMAKIHGMPMIGHVYLRTRMSDLLLDTYVATCDVQIFDYIESIGGKAIMTSDTHERATDRTGEAMLGIEKQIGKKIDIVIMVQGDEPMVVPDMISKSIEPFLAGEGVDVVNLMSKIETLSAFEDPNEVKVVVDKNSDAIYFSREPIPSRKKGYFSVPMMKQVCIIPFRREALIQFNLWNETELEKIESVDMMRIIENGKKVRMVRFDGDSVSVDTQADLENAERIMSGDILMHAYL